MSSYPNTNPFAGGNDPSKYARQIFILWPRYLPGIGWVSFKYVWEWRDNNNVLQYSLTKP